MTLCMLPKIENHVDHLLNADRARIYICRTVNRAVTAGVNRRPPECQSTESLFRAFYQEQMGRKRKRAFGLNRSAREEAGWQPVRSLKRLALRMPNWLSNSVDASVGLIQLINGCDSASRRRKCDSR
jgi:hypothetical protein